MFAFIKGLFAKKEKPKGTTSADLFSKNKDKTIEMRKNKVIPEGLDKLNTPENDYLLDIYECCSLDIDEEKDSILLLDDNSGVISFLMDDLKAIKKKGGINYEDYNILKLDSKLASFRLRSMLLSNKKMNIKYAILDITIGGTLFNSAGTNITLDGIDSLIDIIEYYPDVNYIFYTGNKLNPYIKKNSEIIEKFTAKVGKDINKHIIFKTSLSREERQKELMQFFSKDKGE